MMRHSLPEADWRKSSYSGDQGANCLEIQATNDGLVAVGDSKDRSQGAFVYTPQAWGSFLGAVKRGELGGVGGA
ncbi:DUF397 domain-containing protein [Streptomyces pathocidini]|uniref:DUF397 domain-containing protein n=1 Tax=Streptomyces pathocidini TaxID=1650571 RepID=A0ABW7UJF5_9ACTN|nr:DUF397 domain-containing protein [Streptomyces pathocidini]